MFAKMVGKGSQYAAAFTDSSHHGLDGSKTYKVHLPPNIPAKDNWSFTLYGNQTRTRKLSGLSTLQTQTRLDEFACTTRTLVSWLAGLAPIPSQQ